LRIEIGYGFGLRPTGRGRQCFDTDYGKDAFGRGIAVPELNQSSAQIHIFEDGTSMTNSVTFKGREVQLSGAMPQIGDQAPDFQLTANDSSTVTLQDSAGKVRLVSTVPSIDTSVCSLETARFNREMDNLPDSVVGYTVSVDTPYAQRRWCGAENVQKMQLLSDFKGQKFGKDYGIYIEELGLLARCVFIIDKDGKIAYTQVVPEVAQEPDYDEAINRARELAG
jgi:thiol peroxidase